MTLPQHDHVLYASSIMVGPAACARYTRFTADKMSTGIALGSIVSSASIRSRESKCFETELNENPRLRIYSFYARALLADTWLERHPHHRQEISSSKRLATKSHQNTRHLKFLQMLDLSVCLHFLRVVFVYIFIVVSKDKRCG